jgi:cytochrome c553
VLVVLTAAGPLALAAQPLAPARTGGHSDDGAAALACRGCHGTASKLGDLGQWAPADILAALRDFRSGARAGTLMPRIARGYSDLELSAMATALGRADGSPRAEDNPDAR